MSLKEGCDRATSDGPVGLSRQGRSVPMREAPVAPGRLDRHNVWRDHNWIASRISSAWPSGLTFGHTAAIRPFSSMR